MIGKVEFSSNYGDQVLKCPGCGGDNLHHAEVQIFDRQKEDSIVGRHVVVTQAQVTIDGDTRNNPSSRRDGLLITFDCENCNAELVLMIYQHKGPTFLEWMTTDPAVHSIDSQSENEGKPDTQIIEEIFLEHGPLHVADLVPIGQSRGVSFQGSKKPTLMARDKMNGSKRFELFGNNVWGLHGQEIPQRYRQRAARLRAVSAK